MIPDWMKETESFLPPEGGSRFALRTVRSLSSVTGRLRFQQGKEHKHPFPALLKLILLFAFILTISLSRSILILLIFTAGLLLFLAVSPPEEILSMIRNTAPAVLMTFLLFLPAILLHPEGAFNSLLVVWKVFLSVLMTAAFGQRTQWNHITSALRKLHIPGVFIFILDMTLKNIVILGRFVNDLLTSCIVRSVGKYRKKYQSAGGVMGVTFIRGMEMSRETYEAMRCRGFTDDYRGL